MYELIQTVALCVIATIMVSQSKTFSGYINRFKSFKNRINIAFKLRTARNKVRLLFKRK